MENIEESRKKLLRASKLDNGLVKAATIAAEEMQVRGVYLGSLMFVLNTAFNEDQDAEIRLKSIIDHSKTIMTAPQGEFEEYSYSMVHIHKAAFDALYNTKESMEAEI